MSSIIAELLNVSWDLMKTLENNKMSLVNTDLLASPDDDDAYNMIVHTSILRSLKVLFKSKREI